MKRWIYILLAMTCAGSGLAKSETNDTKVSLFDAEDGYLDFSSFMSSANGFMPVPIVITEPAVGIGAGVALLFFHDDPGGKEKTVAQAGEKSDRQAPPSISGAVGFGTDNGTWGAGGFHMGIWKEDTIRYLGAAFYADVNLDFYETGSDDPLAFNAKATILYQRLMFRLSDSDFFLGADYTFANSDIDIATLLQEQVNLGAVGILAQYDTRDNIFTPNQGTKTELKFQRYDQAVGGDDDFNKAHAKSFFWTPIQPELILGLRLDAQFSGGDIPIYMLPFVDLRGIPAMRYQGAHTLVAETELRWDFTKRWSAVGFIGSGWVADYDLNDFKESDAYVAGGGGFRYLIAKAYHMRAGIDVARGPEDTAIYLTIGSAWR